MSHFGINQAFENNGNGICFHCGLKESEHEPVTRVENMRAGTLFQDSHGKVWRWVRPDGALSGVYHCERADGVRGTFAGCAEFHVTAIPEVFVS